jgi:hypothetical protein
MYLTTPITPFNPAFTSFVLFEMFRRWLMSFFLFPLPISNANKFEAIRRLHQSQWAMMDFRLDWWPWGNPNWGTKEGGGNGHNEEDEVEDKVEGNYDGWPIMILGHFEGGKSREAFKKGKLHPKGIHHIWEFEYF